MERVAVKASMEGYWAEEEDGRRPRIWVESVANRRMDWRLVMVCAGLGMGDGSVGRRRFCPMREVDEVDEVDGVGVVMRSERIELMWERKGTQEEEAEDEMM